MNVGNASRRREPAESAPGARAGRLRRASRVQAREGSDCRRSCHLATALAMTNVKDVVGDNLEKILRARPRDGTASSSRDQGARRGAGRRGRFVAPASTPHSRAQISAETSGRELLGPVTDDPAGAATPGDPIAASPRDDPAPPRRPRAPPPAAWRGPGGGAPRPVPRRETLQNHRDDGGDAGSIGHGLIRVLGSSPASTAAAAAAAAADDDTRALTSQPAASLGVRSRG